MKKIIALILVVSTLFTLSACSKKDEITEKLDVEIPVEPTEEELLLKETEAFIAETKEGRTELVLGTSYEIQDGLVMTPTEYLFTDLTYNFTTDDNYKTLYFKAVFENISDEGIYIRQDGIRIDGEYYLKWGSDVKAKVELVGLNAIIPSPMYLEEPNASNFVYKFEELSATAYSVNCNNHIYLEPGEQGEYYFSIQSLNIDAVQQTLHYAIITFENYEFYCDLTNAVNTIK